MVWASFALAQGPPAIQFTVQRFQVEGDNPLDPASTEQALAPFLGEYSGIDGLLAAGDALEKALSAAGHSFHRVSLPPQDLASGVVVLKVVTFGIGEVQVKGNQHFSEANIRRSLPKLAAAGTPNLREISRSLAVANQHPRKRLRVNFRESEATPDALDAVVNVQDQRPWSLFAALNNIGNKDTGYTRLALGTQHSNLFGYDDIFTGSFTTSPDNADDVSQFGAFYQIPVYPLSGWLTGFYVDSDVDVGNVQDAFDISGAGNFVGLSFKRQLIGVGRYRHTFSAGIQDRLFDTAIASSASGVAIPGISTKVRSRPVSLRYDGGYNWRTTSLDFYIDFTKNLSFGGHNNAVDYAKVRAVAEPEWSAMRFGALVTQQIVQGWNGVARLTGQFTDEPLIPGEQFGLGGERSVRGFEERTIAGDTGLQINFELWTPPVAQLYGVRFLAFLDAGYKEFEQPLAAQRPNDTISSVGVGARWEWRDQVLVSLDYGQPIANADGEASDRGNSKWHANLQYRY